MEETGTHLDGRRLCWQVRALGAWLVRPRRSDCSQAGGWQIRRAAKRWIVERTFDWFGKYHRLAKDYETLPRSSECIILIAMINLLVHRLLSPG